VNQWAADQPHIACHFSPCSRLQGQAIRYMCSMYLSVMDKLGIQLDSFGDSSQRLTEI
jgi:hypothetical protein